MPKPPKPPRIKKSLEFKEDDYNEICRLAKKTEVTWAEMARTIMSLGIWSYRARAK